MLMFHLTSMVSRKRGWLRRAIKNETGATAVEYALIVTFVGLVIVTGVSVLGNQLNLWYNALGTKVNGWIASS